MTIHPASEVRGSPMILRNPRQKPHIKDMGDIVALTQILSWMRPHKTDAEEQFIHDFIDSMDAEKDEFGNRFIRLGSSPILWSAHIDTVHRKGGYQRLTLHPDGVDSYDIHVNQKDGNCLGADDGTGVWMLLQMIKANKPGLYVFHRGEECGCLGSTHISKKEADLLKGIQYAVAFDRRGYDSVITHQRGTRCCSQPFATAFAKALGGSYRADDTGSYTDTAEYIKQIPECTNLSVGYFAQHTNSERQNIKFIRELKDKMLAINVLDLPVTRNPSVTEYRNYGTTTNYGGTSYYPARKAIEDMSPYELLREESYRLSRWLTETKGITKEELIAAIRGVDLAAPSVPSVPTTPGAYGYPPAANEPWEDYGG